MNGYTPYEDAEDAFFSMASMQRAKSEGFRPTAGAGLYERPGNGLDVQKTIERLYKAGRLGQKHLRILKFYGRQGIRPDPRREDEEPAYEIWNEAMDIINDALKGKGIVRGQGR